MKKILTLLLTMVWGISYTQKPLYVESKSYDAKCYNDLGKINLTKVEGGSGYGTYTYLWSNGHTKQNLDSVKAGIYSVKVTDNLGDFVIIIDTINEPKKIELTSVVEGGNGSAKIVNHVSGGVGEYQYKYFYLGTKKNVQKPIEIKNFDKLGMGYYRVRVIDTNGCTMETKGWVEVKEVDVTRESVYLKEYPNPINNYSVFEYKVPENSESYLKFVFMSPSVILYETKLDSHSNKLDILTVSFPNGFYNVTIEVDGEIRAHARVLIQH